MGLDDNRKKMGWTTEPFCWAVACVGDMTFAEKQTLHILLHRLWTKAVGTPDYVKTDWISLEALLLKLQEEIENATKS